MSFATISAHIVQGPLDALLEFGLPLVILGVLWWWARRAERGRPK
jgi:hypothetical protein